MKIQLEIDTEIEMVRTQLMAAARLHKFNLAHPQVIDLSQQLDKLIVKTMAVPAHTLKKQV